MKPLIQEADEPVESCGRDMPLLCEIWFDVVLGHGGTGEKEEQEKKAKRAAKTKNKADTVMVCAGI